MLLSRCPNVGSDDMLFASLELYPLVLKVLAEENATASGSGIERLGPTVGEYSCATSLHVLGQIGGSDANQQGKFLDEVGCGR